MDAIEKLKAQIATREIEEMPPDRLKNIIPDLTEDRRAMLITALRQHIEVRQGIIDLSTSPPIGMLKLQLWDYEKLAMLEDRETSRVH
jgi:hypothetical protein